MLVSFKDGATKKYHNIVRLQLFHPWDLILGKNIIQMLFWDFLGSVLGHCTPYVANSFNTYIKVQNIIKMYSLQPMAFYIKYF